MGKIVNTVKIPREIFVMVIKHCQEALPNEACGFLSGKVNETVSSIWRMKNEANSRHQFLVSRANVKETLRKVEAKKEQVIALYHSHPTAPPIPSTDDLRYHPDEEVNMLILSLMHDNLTYKCYAVHYDNYTEVPIQFV
ncbi:Proteasome lid subunit RPN8/RPN11, contains Jab1/MPN metalloenzyme (JAMM) motif [Oceanobacillus limi]|uniref:Proteasome lid subunit RPN8/RPN11, contains Jab1/MPN metalloenzyme (JAMM) motif n=1 Tax=Oceanobacillus limi TaxID=930131 RepID=A0A1I0H061_9BACI|nr:M67 family metallopeptidase [Oceanobacillus limi]SET76899.1 Proteasome lid subunit RPN8/RPN11, contains Jab1/MPN metalloenzyme (JAMM) motif [Oceanobacillus limi]